MGIEKWYNSARSATDSVVRNVAQGIGNKAMMLDHIDYGIITEVDYSTYQVQVRILGDPGNVVLGKRFWPLVTRREEIFLKYGKLRKGMYVRVHWRGRNAARFVVIDIISDENFDALTQQDVENKLLTGPFKLFSGGLIPV